MSGRIHSIIAIAVLCGGCPLLFAQQVETDTLILQQYRPAWGVIPDVKRPAFDYSEVHNGKLIAEAAESLDYLSIDNLIIGNTRCANTSDGGINTSGYQVVGPNGEIFYVDDLKSPNCAVRVVAQQIESGDGTIISQPGAGVSSVYIGEINFEGCS